MIIRRRSSFFLSLLLLLLASKVDGLRILLTNNNGLEDIGLQLLKTALRDAGHEVFVYAPATEFQGAALALTLPVVNVEPTSSFEEYSVNGYTATCVLVGISALASSGGVDLIISGINDGYTSGGQDLHSGTLGGALTGLSKGIPSIAVMSDSPEMATEGQEVVDAYFQRAATFVVGLVDALNFTTFPFGIGLKLIYPSITSGGSNTPLGVVLARDNSYFFVTFDYVRSQTEPNTLDAELNFVDNPPPNQAPVDSDYSIVQDGFISVLPIHADISVGASRYNENFINTLRNQIETQVPF